MNAHEKSVEQTRKEFAAFVEEFQAAVERKRRPAEQTDANATAEMPMQASSNDLEASVRAFREDCHRRASEFTAYQETFYSDVASRRAERTAAHEALGNSIAAVTDDASETGRADDSTDQSAQRPTDTSQSEPETTAATEADPADADGPSAVTVDMQTVSDEDATEPDQSESVDELSQAQEAADDTTGLRDELADIPHGTLKKAANALDYDGDLNAATKAELIDFFSRKDMTELEAALEE